MALADQTAAALVASPLSERSTVTFAVSPDQMAALERMMEATEQTRTELVRRGLQLLGKELDIPFPIRLRIL